MSPYATTLAHARLDALRKLIDALNEAETPEEKRRCAVAIFNAPDPCNLDDEIELEEEEEEEEEKKEYDDSTAAQVQSLDTSADSPHDHEPDGDAPAAHDPAPASNSAIQDHISRIPADILTALTNRQLISQSISLHNSRASNQLAAPS